MNREFILVSGDDVRSTEIPVALHLMVSSCDGDQRSDSECLEKVVWGPGGSRLGSVRCRERLLWCRRESVGACAADVMPLTIDVHVNISQSVAISGEDKVFGMAEKRYSQ